MEISKPKLESFTDRLQWIFTFPEVWTTTEGSEYGIKRRTIRTYKFYKGKNYLIKEVVKDY